MTLWYYEEQILGKWCPRTSRLHPNDRLDAKSARPVRNINEVPGDLVDGPLNSLVKMMNVPKTETLRVNS